jgi:hypothetical protein
LDVESAVGDSFLSALEARGANFLLATMFPDENLLSFKPFFPCKSRVVLPACIQDIFFVVFKSFIMMSL